MSRSNRGQNVDNPVKAYIRWKGDRDNPRLSVYNRETKETTARETLDFIVIDWLFGITGKEGNSDRYYSTNKVPFKEMEDAILKLWLGKELLTEGTYRDIKNKYGNELPNGARYTTYLIVTDKNASEIYELELAGSGNQGFIHFQKSGEDYFEGLDNPYEGKPRPDVYDSGISIVGKSELVTKGSVKYYAPIFDTFEISEEVDAKAEYLDKIVQEYIKNSKKYGSAEVEEPKSSEDFYKETAESAQEHTAPEIPEDDFAGQDEEDDDLPF